MINTIMTIDGEKTSDLLNRLKRKHKITIHEMAKRGQFTLKLVRFVLEHGVSDHYALRDWIQVITGTDPGPIALNVVYRKIPVPKNWRV